jgi:hypothetical protein
MRIATLLKREKHKLPFETEPEARTSLVNSEYTGTLRFPVYGSLLDIKKGKIVSSRKQQKLRTVQDVYAAIPQLDCQGKCQRSCGVIPLFPVEVELLKDKAISAPRCSTTEPICSALKEGKCSIYENRPFICRLWGNVPKMPCLWGCKPKRYLAPQEEKKLLAAMLRLSGGQEPIVNVDSNPLEIAPAHGFR